MDELSVKRGASRSIDPRTAVAELHAAIADPDAALTVIYCAATYDLDELGAALAEYFGDTAVIGATTAGEITPIGYLDGSLVGISIGGAGLRAETVRIDGISGFHFSDGDAAAHDVMARLGGEPGAANTFGLLLVDGLSMQEELIVSSLYRTLGGTPLFGGSAGDGTDFGQTFVYHDGAFRTDCAVFTLVRCDYPFVVFKTEHFQPTAERMVVTGAIPGQRIVTEINGEPAAREYARMVGVEVEELTPLVFSTYPVVVRIGGKIYVRSIQKVNDDGTLTFFCAIESGIVLTVAEGGDMVSNLCESFDEVRREVGPPTVVLGCDCILRNLEAKERGLIPEVGEVMANNNVIGFATYGEQYNGMHVNQTFTGVAIGARRAA